MENTKTNEIEFNEIKDAAEYARKKSRFLNVMSDNGGKTTAVISGVVAYMLIHQGYFSSYNPVTLPNLLMYGGAAALGGLFRNTTELKITTRPVDVMRQSLKIVAGSAVMAAAFGSELIKSFGIEVPQEFKEEVGMAGAFLIGSGITGVREAIQKNKKHRDFEDIAIKAERRVTKNEKWAYKYNIFHNGNGVRYIPKESEEQILEKNLAEKIKDNPMSSEAISEMTQFINDANKKREDDKVKQENALEEARNEAKIAEERINESGAAKDVVEELIQRNETNKISGDNNESDAEAMERQAFADADAVAKEVQRKKDRKQEILRKMAEAEERKKTILENTSVKRSLNQ